MKVGAGGGLANSDTKVNKKPQLAVDSAFKKSQI